MFAHVAPSPGPTAVPEGDERYPPQLFPSTETRILAPEPGVSGSVYGGAPCATRAWRRKMHPNHLRPPLPTATRASCLALLHEIHRLAMFSTSTAKTVAGIRGRVEASPTDKAGVCVGATASRSPIAGSDAIVHSHSYTSEKWLHAYTFFASDWFTSESLHWQYCSAAAASRRLAYAGCERIQACALTHPALPNTPTRTRGARDLRSMLLRCEESSFRSVWS